jgi:RNA polymerase sigma-70 factor (ECF subfamily)
MKRLSDNYYIEKVRTGETGCFASLLERYSTQVFSLIVKMVGNREDAEELTQDVFVKAYGALASFRGESSFSTWIYRIAYNMAVSAVRKKKTAFMSVDEDRMPDVPDGEAEEAMPGTTDPEERLRILNLALERLSPEERAVIMLFYKENRSMEEIAAIAGLTVSNVKTKVFRIRKKLWIWMKAMEEREYESG